jgi:hypothetical protein
LELEFCIAVISVLWKLEPIRRLIPFCFVTVPEHIVQSWSRASSALSMRMAKLQEVVNQLQSKCNVANNRTVDLQRNSCIKRDHEVLMSL